MNRALTAQTPLGPVRIEAGKTGICAVHFGAKVENTTEAKIGEGDDLCRTAADELCAYLDGRLKKFSVPVDLSWTTPFLKDIYSALMAVPFGCTTSYAALAAAAGRFGAARAVGGAMAKNRTVIFVPCHRVIASDGRIGGWSGPPGMKEKLHALEGIGPLFNR